MQHILLRSFVKNTKNDQSVYEQAIKYVFFAVITRAEKEKY